MKKLYALLAAAATFVGANAQLYFVGAGEGLDWTPETPLTVELKDGAYTTTINNLTQFKMSTVQGSWDDFNSGALTASLTEGSVGNAVELTPGDANIMVPWKGDWTITVPADLSTITVTTTTSKPDTGEYTVIYLRGGMNSWLNDATDEYMATWQMETADGKTYWFDCQGETMIPAGVEFKIADANWTVINYSAGSEIMPGESETEPEFSEWTYNNSVNTTLFDDYTGTIMAVLPDVAQGPMMVALFPVIKEHTTGVSDVVVDNNVAPIYYNLQGVRVAQPENGLFIVVRGSKVAKELVK